MNTTNRHFGAFTLVTMLLALFITSSAMSQDFGIKVGLSLSNQSYDYDIAGLELDRLNQYGFSAGTFLSHKIGFLSEIRFEVDFVQKGSGTDILITTPQYPDGLELFRFTDRINYVSVKVLATPSLLSTSAIAPYFIIGPRLDILAGYTTAISFISLDELNSTVIGATIGVGIILNSKSSAPLLLEATYSPDFSNAYEKGVLTVKNNSFQLMAGFSF